MGDIIKLKNMKIIIKKTDEADKAFLIAQKLPDFFDAKGLGQIKQDTKNHILYGAYLGKKLIGFATYKEINLDTIEMTWLGVLPKEQRLGVGAKLVNESLNELSSKYKICEVKTLAETDPYEPYKKTRSFYKSIGFVPGKIISPYSEWGNNPCQVFTKIIRK